MMWTLYNLRRLLLIDDHSVKERAYQLFINRGGEHGKGRQDWFIVERLLIGRTLWRLFGRLLLAVVAGLVVSVSWHLINVLKPGKISLWLQYAYEYGYRGATGHAGNTSKEILESMPISIPVTTEPIGFVFAVGNQNIRSLKRASLHLIIPPNVEVTNPGPFTTFIPNEEYFFYYEDQYINNGVVQMTDLHGTHHKLSFKFAKPGEYRFTYFVAGEDIEAVKKSFFIHVR